MLRTNTLGELREKHIGQAVTLAGWVHRRRDHGGLIFIDLRDHYGVTQIAFHPDATEAFRAAEKVRPEWVLQVKGNVRKRPAGTRNQAMPTGMVELECVACELLATAETPPFEIEHDEHVNEESRLRYRYLDLRRSGLHERIRLRGEIVQLMRMELTRQDFTEIETPLLTSSSPEGARDYLVPSRIHPHRFYALPQAPQQFKQLLMIGGFDKYFQVARAIRDEDLRGDRQPEHTQLDIEMSFVEEEDVFALIESLYGTLTKKFVGKRYGFERLGYKEAIDRFGSDKPDLRITGLELTDVTDVVRASEFKVFSEAEQVRCLVVPRWADISRGELDALTALAQEEGGKGMAWLKVPRTKTFESPIAKYLSDTVQQQLHASLKLKAGDLVLFAAGTLAVVSRVLSGLRNRIGKERQELDPKHFAFAWIRDFPMFEYDEDQKRWDFSHNPFTRPQVERGKAGVEAINSADPAALRAYQYDLVCNGYELGSGSIRNNDMAQLQAAFAKVGYTEDYFAKHFGKFAAAFRYGAPPHGGIALGIDRYLMLVTDQPNIREVIAFPKTQQAEDIMLGSPRPADEEQLRDLHIQLRKQ